MALHIQLYNKQKKVLYPYTDSFKNVIQKIPQTQEQLQKLVNATVLYLGPQDQQFKHGFMYRLTKSQVVIDDMTYDQYSWQDVSPYTQYIRKVITQDTALQRNHWYACQASNLTLTLPKGEKDIRIKVSSTLTASNIIVVPYQGDTIQGDAEGFVIDKVSGALQFHWAQSEWIVVDINSLISAAEDKLPLAGGTMTGTITKASSNNVLAKNEDSRGLLYIYGGTQHTDGSFLLLTGSEGIQEGEFFLVAVNIQTGERHVLRGTKDGRITWKDKPIAFAQGNLKLQKLEMSSFFSIFRNVADSYLGLYGGYQESGYEGAQLFLCGEKHKVLPSVFQLRASKIGLQNILQGDLQGNLTWLGRDITLGYPNYNAKIDLGVLSNYSVVADGWIFAQCQSAAFWKIYVNESIVFSNEGIGSCLIPVKKGDTISIYNVQNSSAETNSASAKLHFYPNR